MDGDTLRHGGSNCGTGDTPEGRWGHLRGYAVPIGDMVLPRGEAGRGKLGMGTHICDDGHPEVGHVGDDLTVLCWDLSVLDQLVQVLLSDTWKCNGEMVSS